MFHIAYQPEFKFFACVNSVGAGGGCGTGSVYVITVVECICGGNVIVDTGDAA